MFLANIFRPPQAARDAANFVSRYLSDKSAAEYFSAPEFKNLHQLAQNSNWDKVAAEYREITGVDLKTSVIAAQVLINLKKQNAL